MKFTEILETLKKGERVTREKWEKPSDSCAIDFIMYDQKKDKCEFYRDGKYYDEFVWVYEDIIAEDWKIYEEPNQVWKPKRNEEYYFVTSCGNVGYDDFNCYIDENRVNFKNAFRTEEEASKILEKIKIIKQLQELSNVNFNDDYPQSKFVIYYNTEKQQIRIDEHRYSREIPFNVYFATKEDCQKAIDTIGEDNLKKYYFDIKDNQ